jgi:multidrug efflux pump subunit AcrB
VAANLLLLLILGLGLMQIGQLRKETFPSIEPNRITVSVTYESGSAKQAEEGLALKIEEALQGVSGIKKITSDSNSMGTTVSISKKSSADLAELLNDVKDKVDAISTFPAGARNPVVSKQRRQSHALQIALYGDADRQTLQQLQTELKQALLRKPAIRQINTTRERDPLISIELDEGKLQAFGLTLADVASTLNNESSNVVAGQIRSENRTISIKAATRGYRQHHRRLCRQYQHNDPV